jgi:rod shape determining protein RodA
MIKNQRVDLILIVSVLLVISAGIFTLYTQESVFEEGGGRWIRQIAFAAIGIIALILLRKANYAVIGEYALPFYLGSLFLLAITLIPFIGSEIKGARSWIRLGFLGVQTSEVAKLATIILLAKFLEMKEKDIVTIPSLIQASLIGLIPMGLILIQPDFGGAFSFAPILFTMLFIAGADLLHIGSVLTYFSVLLMIPLYVEYHKITLVDPLIQHLSELGRDQILPAVRILRSDVWNFIEKGTIPLSVDGSDREYLRGVIENAEVFNSLKEAVDAVRADSGGLLFRILDNEILLLVVATLFIIISAVLFFIRFTQGRAMEHLRRYYIPFGVLGFAFLSAVSFHVGYSFKYHQVVRVTAFVNPEKFPRDLAYQIRASKAAIGSGQTTGRGMFSGDMTMGERPLVPEATTDFIFTAWSERTGFIGAFSLLFVLLIIPLRGFQISLNTRERFGILLGSGISCMYLYHMIINTGIALGLLPVTGLPLSFMSYGGSHLIVCLSGIGILLSIHRRRFAN